MLCACAGPPHFSSQFLLRCFGYQIEEEVRLPFFPIPKWTPPEKDSRVGHPWCSRGKRAAAFLVQKKIQGWRLSVPDGQTLIMAHPPSFSWPTMSCFLCAGNNSWPLQSIAWMQHFQLLRWWKMVAVYLNLCCIFRSISHCNFEI